MVSAVFHSPLEAAAEAAAATRNTASPAKPLAADIKLAAAPKPPRHARRSTPHPTHIHGSRAQIPSLPF